ncbi:hypothetical protein [Neobacillus sp. LXY-4]|uniref:hypothetical protein n=1 Tax=Neobacillus sp. LXY-4 TaxID=3379826 RepID=UPI003EDF4A74
MKINLYPFRLAILLIVIFGGTFTLRYFKTGELLLDQLIGGFVGLALLLFAFYRRKMNKTSY